MTADPVHVDCIPIRASAIKDIDVIAGIDRGGTLTKIAFLPKNTSLDNADFVPLRCLTFLNANFEDALVTMRDQAQLPSSGKLHCSGVGCANYKDKIKQILGMDLQFVPEQLCILRGTYLTIINTKLDDILFPTPPFKAWKFSSDYLDEAFKGRFDEKQWTGPFPAGVAQIGSGSGVGLIDAAGRSKFVGLTALAGKTFMGLARILLGTTDYNEIMALAAKGDRGKLDFQIKDMLTEDGPEYGQFPPSMPIFPFGKAAKETWEQEHATREDKAASLLGFFVGGILMLMLYVSRMTGVKLFYVGGNFTRAEIARSLMMEAVTLLKGDLNICFLTTGHAPVVGAMLSTEDDTLQKWFVKDLDL